ncbi:MAG: biotin--[acetyl-CoA-carboxylase] ligase [Clostridiales bacterium]|jgi:BirA family biotin operon repressor/biotin-[acetyl-CoA-carboxylase] ligase|nr:biotin--[acetyl-CoA-carboxylase] ligase [Clostridiales bacterium]
MELPFLIYNEITSTNAYGLELAKKSASSGTAILALKQTKGRGQFSRTWDSPVGGMYLSVIFRSSTAERIRKKIPHIPSTLAVGSVIRDFLIELTSQKDFVIKSPNDILFDNRKICGILCEAVTCGFETQGVIGIGLNVNNAYEGGANLREIMGKEMDVVKIARMLRARLNEEILGISQNAS